MLEVNLCLSRIIRRRSSRSALDVEHGLCPLLVVFTHMLACRQKRSSGVECERLPDWFADADSFAVTDVVGCGRVVVIAFAPGDRGWDQARLPVVVVAKCAVLAAKFAVRCIMPAPCLVARAAPFSRMIKALARCCDPGNKMSWNQVDQMPCGKNRRHTLVPQQRRLGRRQTPPLQ